MEQKQISYIQSKIIDVNYDDVVLELRTNKSFDLLFSHFISCITFKRISKMSRYFEKNHICYYVSFRDDRVFLHFYEVD